MRLIPRQQGQPSPERCERIAGRTQLPISVIQIDTKDNNGSARHYELFNWLCNLCCACAKRFSLLCFSLLFHFISFLFIFIFHFLFCIFFSLFFLFLFFLHTFLFDRHSTLSFAMQLSTPSPCANRERKKNKTLDWLIAIWLCVCECVGVLSPSLFPSHCVCAAFTWLQIQWAAKCSLIVKLEAR